MPTSTPQERERVLDAVREIVRGRLPEPQAAAVLGTVDAHLAEIAGSHLLGGVNPARADSDGEWAAARWAALEPTTNVGAVHLELGTFTTFPDERVEELLAGDGLGEFLRLDFDKHYGPDLVADVTALPLRTASVDRVASNSLVEHVSDPHKLLAESYRVLRPGGVMVVVMPFVWHLHGYPHDYVRLTPQFFVRACRQAGFTDVVVDRDDSSGLYNVLHNASKMAGVDADRPEADTLRAVHEAVIALLGALIPLDRFFEDAARQWFHSVSVVARKPGVYEPSRRAREPHRPLVERVVDLLAEPETKAPLELHGDRLECEFAGRWFPVEGGSAIFTEPRQLEPPSEPLRDRARRVAAAARRRLR